MAELRKLMESNPSTKVRGLFNHDGKFNAKIALDRSPSLRRRRALLREAKQNQRYGE